MTELWQNTKQMQQLLIQQQILKQKPKNPKILIRPFNWKSKCSSELTQQINNLSSYYQSESEFWYCISHDLNPFTEEFLCPICKTNRLKFVGRKGSRFNDAYNSTCCNCSANAVEAKKERTRQTISSHSDEFKKEIKEKCNQTRLEHFGDPHYGLYGSKSFKQNLKDKYGSETYNNREKCKQTNLERYGVEWNTQLEEVKKRSLATKIEKYGCGNNVEKIKQTCINKYGVEFYVQSDEFKEKEKNIKQEKSKEFELTNNVTRVIDLLSKYGQGWLCLNLPKIEYNGYKYIDNKYLSDIQNYFKNSGSCTLLELELRNFLETFKLYIEYNNGLIINPYELDAYIPELKLAFEFNGIYWHSINKGKDKNYHIMKTKLCRDKNITLIHIFEDLWKTQQETCKQHITNAINNVQLNINQIDGCFYYPQKEYKIKSITEPKAFYCDKHFNRIYVTTENLEQLMTTNYVCYDCGQVLLERII